jgi:uncharacterized radical SAM protein YgiQ
VVELARSLAAGKEGTTIRGLCYRAVQPPPEAVILPDYATVARDKQAFCSMFATFYDNNDALTACTLAQQQDSRFLIHNPPQPPLSTAEVDAVHALDFERDVHPLDRGKGQVPALATIRFALTTHRGCYGECNFCAIAVHQGRTIQERSIASIVSEARHLAAHPDFKGMIADVGGPTANMFGFECAKKRGQGACRDKRCLFPSVCPSLHVNHGPLISLLRQLRQIPAVKKIAVASGLRYDLILADAQNGLTYLRELVRHHVSGQLKIAPEHSEAGVLAAMGKPGIDNLLRFREIFMRLTREEGLDQFLTYYLIAAHPGCTEANMERLRDFCRQHLHILPRQVQLFTPTPCTWSTLMYWTETDPLQGQPCFVEKTQAGRERQKEKVTGTAALGRIRAHGRCTAAPRKKRS